MPQPSPNVTELLRAWSAGDKAALDQLIPVVYDELRRQASRYLRRELPGHTLQTTALVNEAYVRLVDQKNVQWHDERDFSASDPARHRTSTQPSWPSHSVGAG